MADENQFILVGKDSQPPAKFRETLQDANFLISNSTFIVLNHYLLTYSKTHKAKNQRS